MYMYMYMYVVGTMHSVPIKGGVPISGIILYILISMCIAVTTDSDLIREVSLYQVVNREVPCYYGISQIHTQGNSY